MTMKIKGGARGPEARLAKPCNHFRAHTEHGFRPEADLCVCGWTQGRHGRPKRSHADKLRDKLHDSQRSEAHVQRVAKIMKAKDALCEEVREHFTKTGVHVSVENFGRGLWDTFSVHHAILRGPHIHVRTMAFRQPGGDDRIVHRIDLGNDLTARDVAAIIDALIKIRLESEDA